MLIWYSYSIRTYLGPVVPSFVFNNLLLPFIGQLQSQNLSLFVQSCLLLKNNWINAIPNRWKDCNNEIIDIFGPLLIFTWRIVNYFSEPKMPNKFPFSKESIFVQLDTLIQARSWGGAWGGQCPPSRN